MELFVGEIKKYILDKALVLIPVLLIIGYLLKATPKCPNWCIPWALLVISIALSVLMLGLHVDAVIQGVLIAGAAVYGNQLYKQTKKRTNVD